jgi:ABC-type uncharacterized transport system auxiliary subunit
MRYAPLLLLAACAGNTPETRYYQLAAPPVTAKEPAAVAVAVEPLVTDAAYDDDRIVYRLTPYRLDYYNYQRWSSPPGTMLGNYLQDVIAKSGRFRAVLHEASDAVPVTLGGRVIALEEIDKSKTQWVGHVAVELTLTDTVTNKVLWAQQYDETEPLKEQTPEGLAQAISTAMARITERALPTVAEIAEQQQKVHEARLEQRADHGDHRQ